jgi:hypothetical protein
LTRAVSGGGQVHVAVAVNLHAYDHVKVNVDGFWDLL